VARMSKSTTDFNAHVVFHFNEVTNLHLHVHADGPTSSFGPASRNRLRFGGPHDDGDEKGDDDPGYGNEDNQHGTRRSRVPTRSRALTRSPAHSYGNSRSRRRSTRRSRSHRRSRSERMSGSHERSRTCRKSRSSASSKRAVLSMTPGVGGLVPATPDVTGQAPMTPGLPAVLGMSGVPAAESPLVAFFREFPAPESPLVALGLNPGMRVPTTPLAARLQGDAAPGTPFSESFPPFPSAPVRRVRPSTHNMVSS
jgi:hypothetical protein